MTTITEATVEDAVLNQKLVSDELRPRETKFATKTTTR